MTGKGVGCCKKMAEFLMLSVDDLEMIILELFLSFFYLIFFSVSAFWGKYKNCISKKFARMIPEFLGRPLFFFLV